MKGDEIFEAQMKRLEEGRKKGIVSVVDIMRPYVEYQQRLWLKIRQMEQKYNGSTEEMMEQVAKLK